MSADAPGRWWRWAGRTGSRGDDARGGDGAAVEAARVVAAAQRLDAQPDVGGALQPRRAAQRVALADQRGEVAGKPAIAARARRDEHVRDARVQAELRHLLSMAGDARLVVERAERAQHLARLAEVAGGRLVEPAQLRRVARAPARELEGEPREVGLEDLRRREGGQGAVLGLRPQPVAGARLHAPCAPGALLGRGPAGADGLEAAHPGVRIEARHARQPGIDDDPDALDGEAALRDRCREHDLPSSRRRRPQGGVLLLERQVAVERRDVDMRRQPGGGELVGGAADLAEARQEGEDAARLLGERAPDRGGHGALDAFPRPRPVEMPDGHGMHAALAAHHRRVAEERGHGRRVERGGHHEDAQAGAERRPGVEGEGERQVGLEAALVELVEHDEARPGEVRLALQAPQEQAVRHHLDARVARDPGFAPDAVADRRADLLAEAGRHPARRRARGDAARLEDDDALAGEARRVEQREGHARGLARAGLGDEHGAAGMAERGADLVEHGVDGQRGAGEAGHAARDVTPSRRIVKPGVAAAGRADQTARRERIVRHGSPPRRRRGCALRPRGLCRGPAARAGEPPDRPAPMDQRLKPRVSLRQSRRR